MREEWLRTASLLGDDAVQKLNGAHVAVFGLGGVGGHAVEALARAGVGTLTIVDGDVVSLSNINRQIVALHSTVGKAKTEVMQGRILDVNPACEVRTKTLFFGENTVAGFDFTAFDYVLDCIDDVPAKVLIATMATQANVPFLSAMGTGNKLDATQFIVTDLAKTSVCPLARKLRKIAKEKGLEKWKVLYSKEEPKGQNGVVGSVSFVPSVAGLLMAGEAIKTICQK